MYDEEYYVNKKYNTMTMIQISITNDYYKEMQLIVMLDSESILRKCIENNDFKNR